MAPLVELAPATGLRQGELLGLSWADVDVEGARLTIRRALRRIDGRRVLVEPKTRKSRRTLPLTATAVDALRVQRQHQVEDRLRAGARWLEAEDLVFTTPTGEPIDAKELTHTVQRLLETAQVPRMRWHDLRHGTASLLIAQGVDLHVVMEVLGHSTITLTANTYAHVSEGVICHKSVYSQRAYTVNSYSKWWCRATGSNCRHQVFQSGKPTFVGVL
jgi:integrase